MFVKVARSKQEPGKGGFWKLDLAHLEGTKRISNRPHKKKKNASIDPKNTVIMTEDSIAVANIPHSDVDMPLPEFTLEVMQPLPDVRIDPNIGANVIVEPVVPPPLMQDEDLTAMLLNPTDWDDLQLDMLDTYLDSCFK